MVNKRVLLGLFFFLGAALLFWASSFSPPKPIVHSDFLDVPAPNFELLDLEGNLVTLSEQRGKVVLLTFWASWCGPCREEMPVLQQLFQALEGTGFSILGINIETRPDYARDFAANFKLTFPVLLDTEGKVKEQYGVSNIPQAFLIDKNGRILKRYLGYVDWMTVKQLEKLRSLIGKY